MAIFSSLFNTLIPQGRFSKPPIIQTPEQIKIQDDFIMPISGRTVIDNKSADIGGTWLRCYYRRYNGLYDDCNYRYSPNIAGTESIGLQNDDYDAYWPQAITINQSANGTVSTNYSIELDYTVPPNANSSRSIFGLFSEYRDLEQWGLHYNYPFDAYFTYINMTPTNVQVSIETWWDGYWVLSSNYPINLMQPGSAHKIKMNRTGDIISILIDDITYLTKNITTWPALYQPFDNTIVDGGKTGFYFRTYGEPSDILVTSYKAIQK